MKAELAGITLRVKVLEIHLADAGLLEDRPVNSSGLSSEYENWPQCAKRPQFFSFNP
jgi:hypothetical protein